MTIKLVLLLFVSTDDTGLFLLSLACAHTHTHMHCFGAIFRVNVDLPFVSYSSFVPKLLLLLGTKTYESCVTSSD